jgi:hypothetical protein
MLKILYIEVRFTEFLGFFTGLQNLHRSRHSERSRGTFSHSTCLLPLAATGATSGGGLRGGSSAPVGMTAGNEKITAGNGVMMAASGVNDDKG